MQNLHKLRISDELREKFEDVICQQVKDAVAGASDRDQMLMDYSNYVEGLTPIQSNARWNGASNLQWPLILKAYLTVKGQLVQQVKRDPKATVSAIEADDDKDAEEQEQFIIAKDHVCGLTAALSELTDPVTKYPIALMHVGWKDEMQWKRTVDYQDTETGEVVSEGEVKPEQSYTPIPRRELDTVYSGVDLRAVNTPDWYLYPSNAKDLQKAMGCGEAMMFSEQELLLGVGDESLGYDADAVDDLLEHGPCSLRDPDNAALPDAELGTEFNGRREDGMYECFLWYCSVPIVRNEDGEIITPKYLIGEELRVVVCPQANVMLYLGLSEYQKPRPYVPFYILPRTGELYGMCLPQLLETLQTNADVIAQEFTNALQLATSPVFKMKKSAEPFNEDADFFPGAIFYYLDHPDEIMPMEVTKPDRTSMEVVAAVDAQAQQLYATGGYGQQDAKVRRAVDVKNQQSQAAARFDLFYFYFSGAGREGTGVIEVIRRLVSLYSEHMPTDGEEYLDEAKHKKKVTPEQLKGRFIYRPVGSGSSADPETRRQNAALAKQVATEYWGLAAQLAQRPDILNHLWAAYRQVLVAYDQHNIEELIGDQPQMPDQGPGQPPMLAAMMAGQQGQQNGSNGAAPGMAGMAQPLGIGGMDTGS